MTDDIETTNDQQDEKPDSFSKKAKRLELVKRQRALRIALTFVMCLATILIMVFAENVATMFTYRDSQFSSNVAIIRLLGGFVGLGMAGFITYLYASGTLFSKLDLGSGISKSDKTSTITFQTLAEMVDAVEKSALDIKNNKLITEEDKKFVQEQLQEVVRTSLPIEVLSGIDEKYGTIIRNEVVSGVVEKQLITTRKRLTEFQSDLSKKASAALAWGISTAGAGMLLLFAFILLVDLPVESGLVETSFYYLMRISLVGLVEIVAFFFLQQYRVTLYDQKYITNEITNAEMRLLAFSSAVKIDGSMAVKEIINEIAQTERNFVLKKGESSIFHGVGEKDMLRLEALSKLFKSMPWAKKDD